MEEIDAFNRNTLPLLRTLFTNGLLTQQAMDEFLEIFGPLKGEYVIFKTIPERLKAIITPGHAYRVYEEDFSKVHIGLDNDFSHWIDRTSLRLCPKAEIEKRKKYPAVSYHSRQHDYDD